MDTAMCVPLRGTHRVSLQFRTQLLDASTMYICRSKDSCSSGHVV